VTGRIVRGEAPNMTRWAARQQQWLRGGDQAAGFHHGGKVLAGQDFAGS
jgi:hypothetical protein